MMINAHRGVLRGFRIFRLDLGYVERATGSVFTRMVAQPEKIEEPHKLASSKGAALLITWQLATQSIGSHPCI